MKYKMPDLFTQIHEQDTRTPHGPHTFRGYHAAHVVRDLYRLDCTVHGSATTFPNLITFFSRL